MKNAFSRAGLFAASALISMMAAHAALAQGASYAFSIPAEDAVPALKAFALASGQQFAYDSDALAGAHTHALQGRFTVDAGLKALLTGSGLTASHLPGDVIKIDRAPASDPASDPAASPAHDASSRSDGDDEAQVVVVVGTPGGKGINKVKASYAVTNLTANDLKMAAPKASSEVLTLVPGVWVESSGGVGGANIFVRGFPGTGDAQFVTFQLNGTPIYPATSLSFLDNSVMFRTDDTIERVEALRGGPNPVFSSGQPGLTTNFVLREGGDETRGEVKASFTDYSERRVDAWMSGKLADDLYYMVGGYASTSPGIRNAQFDSEQGSQLTVNVTKKFEGGKLNVYTRATDDHGQWYLPFAVNVPGLDLGTFSELGDASRYASIQVDPKGDMQTFDLGNGRGWKGTVSGVNFEKTFDNGWSVRDHFGFTQGDANTYGLVPDGGAIEATALTGPVTTTSGATLGSGDYVQGYGAWVVLKHLRSLVNDLSASRTFGAHDVSVGYYTASVSSDDWWSLGNVKPMQVKANGEYLAASVTCADLAAAGSGASCFAYGLRDSGTMRVDALYAADSWTVNEKLRIDLGLRNEHVKTDFVLDSGPGYPDGAIDMNLVDKRSRTAWTLGANYSLSNRSGVFVRTSTGFMYPQFDDFRNGTTDTSQVKQYELGYKLAQRYIDLFATGFYNKFTGAKFHDVGGTLEENTNEAKGLELDARLKTDTGFSVNLNGTWQSTKILTSSDPLAVGKRAQRQPETQLRLTPRYQFDVGDAPVTLYGTLYAVGDRYADNENAVKLKGYSTVSLGAIIDFGKFDVTVSGDNLGNAHGFTEGDPRSTTSANARPIFGRSLLVSVGYNF
ncbi:MAG: TonB-dependent receptor domain-containing protein [Asticcacaulis sp.]|uniref:TonB-dependent receptor domain-containing protein n=1 Tax=Asticcacaulis sp. TaxID=1872648 RepID=UPI003F7BF5E3